MNFSNIISIYILYTKEQCSFYDCMDCLNRSKIKQMVTLSMKMRVLESVFRNKLPIALAIAPCQNYFKVTIISACFHSVSNKLAHTPILRHK